MGSDNQEQIPPRDDNNQPTERSGDAGITQTRAETQSGC